MAFTIRHIRYFIAAAEAQNVTKAAADVSISASSITTAIQELEADLGVLLFNRSRKGLKLTFEGGKFLRHCHHILSSISDARYALQNPANTFTGKLVLGVTSTVAGYFLAPLLARFRRSFPNIQTQIIEFKRITIERKLLTNEIDIALILTSNLLNRKEISHETLVKSKRHLWVPPNHTLLKQDIVTLKMVAPFPYIQLTIDEARKTHKQFWTKARLMPNIIFETESIEAMRSLVASGTGVAILSDIIYRPWSLEGNRIERLSLDDDIPTMDIGLAWSKIKGSM